MAASLRIEAIEDEHFVTIRLSDTGPGIPPETLPRVKDPFFTTKIYGNGIGLALVEQIVLAHGGTFSIHGAPTGGTLATVRLPKNSPSVERIKTSGKSQAGSQNKAHAQCQKKTVTVHRCILLQPSPAAEKTIPPGKKRRGKSRSGNHAKISGGGQNA